MRKYVLLFAALPALLTAQAEAAECTEAQHARGCRTELRMSGHGAERWVCVCPPAPNHDVHLYGSEARALFAALDVPRETSSSGEIYKIGRQIVCVFRTGGNEDRYFCSTEIDRHGAFSSSGQPEEKAIP